MTVPSPMQILFICSEADPFIKVGGLGDVAGSLPVALKNLNVQVAADRHTSRLTPPLLDVRLVIPFHGAIRSDQHSIRPAATLTVLHAAGPIPAEAHLSDLDGVPVYLISGPPIPPWAPVYSDDLSFDAHKYVFFSLAALELARQLKWQPHILHANDWHTAPAVYYLGLNRPGDAFFQNTATILGLHNLPYLGVNSGTALGAFGLPPAYDFHLPGWAQHMALPLGLLTADQIVAVSPGYAQEILTPEFGSGLHDFLRSRAETISGILNGLDLERWNPATDSDLAANFSSTDLSARVANRTALEQEFGWKTDSNTPLLAMITRMDYQKGLDLALEALRMILDQTWRVIILGTGLPELENNARRLEQNYPDRVRAVIRFDAALSRRIYAGADAIMMPSRYEPCGLTQMIAMRYGCVPVARATGGLRDTIFDQPELETSTGFLFTQATPESLAEALRRMFASFRDRQNWQNLQYQGMRQDFSWKKVAQQYLTLYQEVTTKRLVPPAKTKERQK